MTQRLFAGITVALVLSLVAGSAVPFAQQGGQIQVRFTGAAPGQQIEIQLDQAINAGKISQVSPTQSVLDLTNMPKAQVDVYEFECALRRVDNERLQIQRRCRDSSRRRRQRMRSENA